MRVALVTNIAAPYRIPVYQELAATPGWSLRIFVSAASEFDRSWRVDTLDLDVERVRGLSFLGRSVTRGRVVSDQVVTRHLPLGLLGALRRFAPHVVISGELGVRTLLATFYCKLFRVPLVIWSYHSRVSASAAGPARRALRRLLLSAADSVVGMGVQAREVLEGLGVPGARIFDAPNAHDHEGCLKALARIDPEAQRRALVLELGCRENIALVVGRLVGAKGVAPLLAAWDRIPERVRADWTLLFVGSGPLARTVEVESAGRLPGEIAWVPAVQPDEVMAFYASARLLVFPTLSEPWGLVVNEALACGLPVVCSRFAGCADDVMRPGQNGWLCDPTDVGAFARVLEESLTSPDLERLGRAARSGAERFRPPAMADGMRRALRSAVGD